ncbi:hypothetical protein BH09PSE5_BH09PSE5_36170 [soil metagenome]
MNHLQDLRVLVLGLGASGLAMARWCARFGAHVQVWDSRDRPPQADALAADAPHAVLHRGALWTQDPVQALAGVQLVLKSPGLSPIDERIAPVLAHARQTGVLIQGELELFARALADLKSERQYDPAVLAITGTNGKTTTATLTARLVERAGRRVALAGNIGPTMLDTLGAALDLEPVIVSDFGKLDETAGDGGYGDEPEELPRGSTAAGSEDEPRNDADSDLDDDDDAGSPLLQEHGVVEQALAAGAQPPDAAEAPAGPDAVVDESGDDGVDGSADSSVDNDDDASMDGSAEAPSEAVASDEPHATMAASAFTEHARTDIELDFESTSGTADNSAGVAPVAAALSDDPDELSPEAERPLPIPLPPPPGPVFEHLPEVWVLELSSFQLDDTTTFEPTAAAVLNVTQDHLDWHGSMQAYAAAKARIHGPGETSSTIMVINRDDPRVVAMLELAPPEPLVGKAAGSVKAAKAQAKRVARHAARRVVRFGLDAPRAPGDFGVVTENGMAWLVRALELDQTWKRKAGADIEDLSIQRLMPADALLIRGRHNWSNALAALSLATSIGCPLAPMLHGLREYQGEAHRVQFVATIGGVDAFDDSKGTNVGATVAALTGLGADRAPAKLVVILGGDGKGQDFDPLLAPVLRYARAVATIGRDAAAIEAILTESSRGDIALQRHDTLEAATRWAFEQARSGDAVLLSPACASLDMFRDYAHRAEVFVSEVQSMARDAGEVA